jgi:tripartite-type tricarboxylate transporter receptor subunit TctC
MDDLQPARRRPLRTVAALSVAILALLAPAAARAQQRAQQPATSFKWDHLNVYIGSSAFGGAGGYDTYGRTLARYIGKYLPGNPTAVPINKPGAGGLTLTNYMFNVARQDGTEIAVVGRGNAMDRMLMGDKSNARFDPEKFNWLGSMSKELAIFAVMQSPPMTLKDLQAGKPIAVGTTGSGGDPYMFGLTLQKLLGFNIHMINGYDGMNEVELAMERNEVQGVTGVSWASIKVDKIDEFKSGKISALLQFALDRSPELPDVPMVQDLVKNDQDKQIVDLVFARQTMGRPFLAPPNIPADRVAVLRYAFEAAMRDPDLVAEAKRIQLEINWIGGTEVQALVDHIVHTPSDVVKRAQALFAE